MRVALIALAVSCILISSATQATETEQKNNTVVNLQIALKSVQSEYDVFNELLAVINDDIAIEKSKLTNIRMQKKMLSRQTEKALAQMNAQYQLMIDNPMQDITTSQNNYRAAIQQQEQNNLLIKGAVTALAQLSKQLSEKNIERIRLLNQRETISEEINIARIHRLKNEIQETQSKNISQSVNCDLQDSFIKCIDRSNLLSKKEVSNTHLNTVFNSVTESKLVSEYKANSSAHVKLISHKILTGEFSGQGTYSSTIRVTMQGVLPKNEACKLLNIAIRYCAAQASQMVLPAIKKDLKDKKDMLYQLTIRSNKYDDEVFINGVRYGSTKLSVMLSPGVHHVVIKKSNYIDFEQNVELKNNMMVRAKLLKEIVLLKDGQAVQDLLASGERGPELISVPAGQLTISVDNTNNQTIKAFSVGKNPITVADFKRFVNTSNYITTAESGSGCVEYVYGKETYNVNLNWRQPGFAQTDEHPVVCISSADTNAYLAWLSKATGQKYRLPNNGEWEYVARAGSNDNYWWGNDAGNSKANCAYCGSQWSNKSTAPVQSFKANKFGLYDTVGNVWELTSGNDLVARGGSWNFAPKLSQIDVRLALKPDFRANYVGFRALREN
ncbi:SUMF1/EgtB/PvdO family nonheme iron enzyme [Moritella sp.]|uniref:formylglycine-generating enzyme family protein n=1 Tax=Moritella sp. TaxID=78556 RepID=UPI001D8BBDD1|nr:SUMF1/EgtB/PvdO family nonheme iron enzyme [Moritella sp.]MCJ8348406.1 SUMF1/EgtB/PvdO family nonheme iron enzyme [Moritella sp.]NQZ38924.1 SUMF1/EgtB/PvdO family nonheme iron enzyme [Moritella sp.]